MLLLLLLLLLFLTLVLNSQGRKNYAMQKIRKQAGMVFTPPPPSQNYQEVVRTEGG